jgi:hypothetical protein
MQLIRLAIIVALCGSITLTTFCASTLGITGNCQPDKTPYVGVVVLFSDAARTQAVSYSTGVLIAPNLVLTTGHSVIGGVVASVCFDQGPITCTMDQDGNMYYNTNQPIYNGVPVPYPAFQASVLAGAKPSQALKTSDVGLIVLDTPVQEPIGTATLPSVGLADSISVNTALQVVGYGVQYQITPRGHDFYTWAGIVSRNSATVNLLSTNFQGSSLYLKCTANAAQDKGGIAYGDSGGPLLYNNNGQSVVLAVNAYVTNTNCAGVTYHTRIDNPQVLNWIYGYL